MFSLPSPKQNHILAALPAEDYARLLPDLEFIAMPAGRVIYESGAHTSYLYFPTTSLVSRLYIMENGASAEIAIIGNEGLVGIFFFLGGESLLDQAIVQSAGEGYRLKASILRRELDSGSKLQQLALRYTQALITQTAQNAVCNRHHNVEQQLCRLLLLSLDRLPGNEVRMTHEQMANLLGVRRESITQAALKLQSAGVIRYGRGCVTVADREEMEARTCECYAVVKNEYDRLLPGDFPVGPSLRHGRVRGVTQLTL